MPLAGLLRHQRALVRAANKEAQEADSPPERTPKRSNAVPFSTVPRFCLEGTHPRQMLPGTLTQVGHDCARLDRWQGGSRSPAMYQTKLKAEFAPVKADKRNKPLPGPTLRSWDHERLYDPPVRFVAYAWC